MEQNSVTKSAASTYGDAAKAAGKVVAVSVLATLTVLAVLTIAYLYVVNHTF
jgi:hypothetical protein